MKLLLVGIEDSGKSALATQLTDLYGRGFSENERMQYLPVIHQNIISAIQSLCRQSEAYSEERKIPGLQEDNLKHQQMVLNLNPNHPLTVEDAHSVKSLWADQAILEG
jgi:guanine nucleotide-binding protein subunit alpha